MEMIEGDLKSQQSFQALKADLYMQMKNWNKARYHLSIAIRESDNQTERRFLEAKLDSLADK
jgi:predicted RNA polymerase sigma factor